MAGMEMEQGGEACPDGVRGQACESCGPSGGARGPHPGNGTEAERGGMNVPIQCVLAEGADWG